MTANAAFNAAKACLDRLADPRVPLYALLEIKGIPYHVARTNLVHVFRMDVPLGARLQLDRVRELGSSDIALRGAPYVAGARVMATVLEHWQSTMKYRARIAGMHRHQRKAGCRAHMTTLRITEITYAPHSQAQQPLDGLQIASLFPQQHQKTETAFAKRLNE